MKKSHVCSLLSKNPSTIHLVVQLSLCFIFSICKTLSKMLSFHSLEKRASGGAPSKKPVYEVGCSHAQCYYKLLAYTKAAVELRVNKINGRQTFIPRNLNAKIRLHTPGLSTNLVEVNDKCYLKEGGREREGGRVGEGVRGRVRGREGEGGRVMGGRGIHG